MSPLEEIICAEIRATGPMRFDRFMELALYHPGLGYYAREKAAPIGRGGDFYTSVSVGPLFGRLLSRQFYQMWQVLDRPFPFWIIEQGAHDGQLANDILTWCSDEVPEFFEAIRYGVVDPENLSGKQVFETRFSMTVFGALEAAACLHPTGVFFSNELVDAFPVRAIIYQSGRWMERRVALDAQGGLVWIITEIEDDELRQEISKRSVPEREGYTTEINLRSMDWIKKVGRLFDRGYVVTIDYGYPQAHYYADFRIQGTLMAYVKHQAVDDVLVDPGMRDLTTHVDFTALARSGREAGLETLGFVDQQRFLMGIAHDEMSGGEGPKVSLQDNVRAWHTLTHPEYLGSTFQVLVQGKNAPAQLDGLRFARAGGLE